MSETVKYFYRGEETDLVVFVESEQSVKDYLQDPSIGKLTEIVEVFKVFTNRSGRGAEGEFGEASKAQLENEFGKGKKVEEIIDIILREGEPNAHSDVNRNKFRSTNDSMGQRM